MNLSRRALLVLAAASLAFGLSIAANGAAAATAAADTPHVTLKTSMGNIVLELYPAGAGFGSQFPRIRQKRPIQRHNLSPRHRRLHDPGRRFR